MIPDDEIEEAAKNNMSGLGSDLEFINGAKWMRERCGSGLQWIKGRGDEIPKEGAYFVLFGYGTMPYSGMVQNGVFDCGDADMKLTPKQVAAYAYIELPDWLK